MARLFKFTFVAVISCMQCFAVDSISTAECSAGAGATCTGVSGGRDGDENRNLQQQQRINAPSAMVMLGERPAPDGPKIPTLAGPSDWPDRNQASQLYAELMAQIESTKSPSISKLLALAVCHSKPRSREAWQQLAAAELQLAAPSFFSFLRAHFVAALLDGEPEWWEEEEAESKENQQHESPDNKVKAAAKRNTLREHAMVDEKVRIWFQDGEYDHLKEELMHNFKSSETKALLNMGDKMLKKLSPLLVEWKVSGSHEMPPLTYKGEAALDPPLWQEPEGKLPGTMRALFPTPLYVVNLADEGAVTQDFNAKMAKQAVNFFETFLTSPAAMNEETGQVHDPTRLNDMFWSAQRGKIDVPEVREIMKHIKAACSRFLAEWNLPPAMTTDDSQLNGIRQAWFSIHSKGSEHIPHIHYDSRLAAVYYPQVREGDGRLIFEDPRGAHYNEITSQDCDNDTGLCSPVPFPFAPFAGNRHYHTPRTGDLVIFPGWLYHSVESAPMDIEGYRVSLSFNLDGYWENSVP